MLVNKNSTVKPEKAVDLKRDILSRECFQEYEVQQPELLTSDLIAERIRLDFMFYANYLKNNNSSYPCYKLVGETLQEGLAVLQLHSYYKISSKQIFIEAWVDNNYLYPERMSEINLVNPNIVLSETNYEDGLKFLTLNEKTIIRPSDIEKIYCTEAEWMGESSENQQQLKKMKPNQIVCSRENAVYERQFLLSVFIPQPQPYPREESLRTLRMFFLTRKLFYLRNEFFEPSLNAENLLSRLKYCAASLYKEDEGFFSFFKSTKTQEQVIYEAVMKSSSVDEIVDRIMNIMVSGRFLAMS